MTLHKLLMATLLSSCFLLTGCPATPEEIATARSQTMSSLSNPDLVGKLADGRSIHRVVVVMPGANAHNHYVYFVDNATVSSNYAVQEGKVTVNNTRVSLPANMTTDEVIAAAEELKKQQRATEEAEYSRLKQKLGK
jgi:hypothetical protein